MKRKMVFSYRSVMGLVSLSNDVCHKWGKSKRKADSTFIFFDGECTSGSKQKERRSGWSMSEVLGNAAASQAAACVFSECEFLKANDREGGFRLLPAHYLKMSPSTNYRATKCPRWNNWPSLDSRISMQTPHTPILQPKCKSGRDICDLCHCHLRDIVAIIKLIRTLETG